MIHHPSAFLRSNLKRSKLELLIKFFDKRILPVVNYRFCSTEEFFLPFPNQWLVTSFEDLTPAMAQLNQLNQKTESKKFFHFSITQAPFNPEPLFCSHTVRAYCSNHLPAGVLNIERFLGVHSVCCTALAAILLLFATLLQSAERKMMAILRLQTSV